MKKKILENNRGQLQQRRPRLKKARKTAEKAARAAEKKKRYCTTQDPLPAEHPISIEMLNILTPALQAISEMQSTIAPGNLEGNQTLLEHIASYISSPATQQTTTTSGYVTPPPVPKFF